MREYNAQERRNVEFLVNKRVEHVTIQITQTGINKSTLDATAPVRTFFKEHGIHDFEKQGQGKSHKVSKRTVILTATTSIETKTTMFRPNTKKGRPKALDIWISQSCKSKRHSCNHNAPRNPVCNRLDANRHC